MTEERLQEWRDLVAGASPTVLNLLREAGTVELLAEVDRLRAVLKKCAEPFITNLEGTSCESEAIKVQAFERSYLARMALEGSKL